MVFLRKLKLFYPSPQALQRWSVLTFLILFKKCLAPPPFTKEGRNYEFYMRDYKGEKIKLIAFYMTDFLITEL